MDISYEALLFENKIEIDGVGFIKIPKLSEILKIKYSTYEFMCNHLVVNKEKYLDMYNLKDEYESLSDEKKQLNSLFNMIISNDEFRKIYLFIFSFFISENIEFDYNNISYVLFNDSYEIVGKIDGSNFEDVRNCLLKINFLKVEEKVEEETYKNETARKWAEKLAKAKEKRENKDKLSLGKMISKFCADNKNGINILNVFDLTIYQFYDQWIQHKYIRECNIKDMIFANTASYDDIKSYDSMLWLK